MFNPTREQARDFFFETWRKYSAGAPLEGAETLALAAILLHPEYHDLLARPGRFADKDYQDESNPFLHLSLHLALEEQLSIDQPPGVTRLFEALLARKQDRHAALHAAIECLAETVWRAQREGRAPDGDAYLRCLVSAGSGASRAG
jgi:hypothetical protein